MILFSWYMYVKLVAIFDQLPSWDFELFASMYFQLITNSLRHHKISKISVWPADAAQKFYI